MAKGTISPFLEHGLVNNERRGRAISTMESPFLPHSSRTSVLSSVVFPYLRRLDTSDDMQTHKKKPLITLKLSSPSFLDSVVNDTLTRHPLYVIKTVGTSTTISRSDPWEGVTKTADIKWPKLIPTKGKGRESVGVLVQMGDGRWKGAEHLLKPSSLYNCSKFQIPTYTQTLKWRRVGNSYWCTSASVKGPIATFDPAIESVPPRLKIYETLQDKYDTRPLLVHGGVSIVLLDYLLVTSLLLVTDVQEWMVVKKYEPDEDPISRPTTSTSDNDDSPRSAPSTASTSASQWRKIIYGEPLFPKLSPESAASSSRSMLHTPTSAEQMAKIVYGDPLYPTLRTPSPGLSMSDSDEEDSGVPSPSESIFYPLTNSSAPSHTYLDPTFYDKKQLPPVPPIPPRYRAGSSHGHTPNGSTPNSAPSFQRLRELPVPPHSAHLNSQPWPRSRSTPPRTHRADHSPSDHPPGTSSSIPASTRQPHIHFAHTRSMSTRCLPQPPGGPTDMYNRTHTLSPGRSEKPTRRPREQRKTQGGARSLPPTPVSTATLGSAEANSAVTAVDANTARTPQHLRRIQKSHDYINWASRSLRQHASETRNTGFDIPPPAYNSINFATPSPVEVTLRSHPPPPVTP